MSLKIRILSKDAKVPTYATDEAAAMDLYAAENAVVPARDQAVIDTGLAVEIMPGKCGQIWPRSGLDSKMKVTRGAGLIDSDYRGPLKVLLVNRNDIDFPVLVGDRIAQMVVVPAFRETLEVVEELTPTERGEGGFGSTGMR